MMRTSFACDHNGRRSSRGFAIVELIVVVLVLGAVAAVIVFSVSGVTDKKTKSNACATEVLVVRASIQFYKSQHKGANPKSLAAVVNAGLLRSVPGSNTPSGAAGYTYDAKTGTYTGPVCPT